MTDTAAFDIRPARAEDLPGVVALIHALADFEKLPGPDAGATERLAADFARGDRFRLLVVEKKPEEPVGSGARLVGYAFYFFTYSTFRARPCLYLEDLFVDAAERGAGIGEALLRRLAAEAMKEGCARFEWTVLDWNVHAQRFYERHGARLLPEWRICRVEGEALSRMAAPAGSL